MMLSTKSRGFFALCSFACALVCACAMLAMPVQASAAERIDDEIVIGDSDSPAISTAISAACGKLTVMVSRAYSDTDGCEYQAALDSSFKKGVRSARSSASKYQFSGLKQGKKYYVRAREYLTVDGQIVFTNWSASATARTAINNGKSAIKGTWKITSSSDPSINSVIKHNKRVSKNAKATITFQKNGSIVFKDYNKKTYKLSKSWGKWVALSKKKGQTVDAGVKSADISVKGKTLIVKKGNMKIVCKK